MKEPSVKCRICWEDKETNVCVSVSTKWAKESLKTIKDIILLCVPWMSIKSNSHLCKPCLWQLKFTYDFIERCLKTENILNEANNKNMVKISLEDILEKSLKSGNKIQIIFESPVGSQTDTAGTNNTDIGNLNESVQESDKDMENVNFEIQTSDVIPSEHDYCIQRGTQMNIDVKKSQQDNTEPITTTQNKVGDKEHNQNVSEGSNTFLNNEKENILNINDNLSDNDTDFLNDSSTECTDVKNVPDSSENNILKKILSKDKKPRCSKTTLKRYNTTQGIGLPPVQFKNELTELLDIAAVDIWFMSTYSEVNAEQQNDLVRDGVNILNMSKDPNKKKRTIYLSRDLFQGYHKCSKCNIAFVSRCDFLDHLHLHRMRKIRKPGAPIYTCKVCSETFFLDIDFRTHSKIHHGICSPHACMKCNRKFRTYKQLNDHNKEFKDQDKCVYTCTKCNREFMSAHFLALHEEHIRDAPCCDYKKCKVCLKKFTKEDFKIHCEQIHSNYLCPECGKSFKGSVSLSAHRRNVHNAMYCMCHECGKILSHPKSLEHHIQAVHGEKMYMCDKCPRQFTTQTYLRKHSQIHVQSPVSARRILRCEKCGKGYVKKETLRQHERMFHLGIKMHTCAICNEGFLRKDYLQRHVKYHEKYSNNTCSVCRKSFGSQWRLESHVLAGHGENGKSLENYIYKRPPNAKNKFGFKKAAYKCVCKICNKVLENPSNLRSHYRAHLRLRQQHKCDKCDVILQTKLALTNHLKLHQDPNFKFSCNICHAYKSSSIELENHMLEVHKNKKYKCTICSEAFGRKHLLMSHEALVHKEETYKKEVLLKMLEENHIFVPRDTKMECGTKTNKGTKLGKLEVDIATVIDKLAMKKEELDMVSGSSHYDTTTLGHEQDVVILRNENQINEDARACRILEEENGVDNYYESYSE